MDPTTAPQKDPMLAATIRQMADIALPPPVSMMPATWGWAVLAGLIVLAFAIAFFLWLRRRAQNRYRRDALAEIDTLEMRAGNEAGRVEALAALPGILKRAALAVWPREQVAALNGPAWVEFLKANAGKAQADADGYAIFTDAEYRLADIDEQTARRGFAAARQWIVGHHVHP
jgi:hypothetical protein